MKSMINWDRENLGIDKYFYLFMVYLTNVISSDYTVSNDSIKWRGSERRYS
jgi:hypothetical protein